MAATKPGALPALKHPAHILICGRKGEGKSELALLLALGAGLPIALVDPTHDATERLAQLGCEINYVTPGKLPAQLGPGIWSLRPDMGHPDADKHMDDFVGLATREARRLGGLLLWCDEFGEMTTGSKTGRHMRAALHHGRHAKLSMLLCCPRPMDIDRLGLAQADMVATYKLPADADRQRVATTIGLKLATLDELHRCLRQHWWGAWYRSDPDVIRMCPPLPLMKPAKKFEQSA